MKTAVEWLVEHLNQKIDYIPLDKWDMIKDLIQQAKQMEKEQICNAYLAGIDDEYTTSTQYYNQTYGEDKSES